MTMKLVGSPRQVAWATNIINRLNQQYPDSVLPAIVSAQWWIGHRADPLEDILNDALVQDSRAWTPFTRKFPAHSRDDAVEAIRTLGDNYVVLDLETTGLKPKKDEIVEVAIIHASGEVLIDTLVRPDSIAWPEKMANHVPISDLESAPIFEEIANQVYQIVTTHNVVAYNAQFDLPFLAFQYWVHGLKVPTIQATCAMRIFSAYMGIDTNMSLSDACVILNVHQGQFGDPHRALPDVLSTIALMKAMLAEGEPNNVTNNA